MSLLNIPHAMWHGSPAPHAPMFIYQSHQSCQAGEKKKKEPCSARSNLRTYYSFGSILPPDVGGREVVGNDLRPRRLWQLRLLEAPTWGAILSISTFMWKKRRLRCHPLQRMRQVREKKCSISISRPKISCKPGGDTFLEESA